VTVKLLFELFVQPLNNGKVRHDVDAFMRRSAAGSRETKMTTRRPKSPQQ